MTPLLARRGQLVVLTGALFVAIGSIWNTWQIIALGTWLLAAMCSAYLWFFQTAILLRRKKVELAWWVPPGDQPGGALTVEHPFSLHLTLRNHGRRPLHALSVHIFSSSALEAPSELAMQVPAGFEVEHELSIRPHAAGHWTLHGALFRLGDLLGLFELRAYFPNPLHVKVFAKLSTTRTERVLARPHVGALHERMGLHTIRRRGLAGDLREIRDHAPGDPFKFIAWKATARRQKLMVREFENEIVITHQLLVDIAGSMRGGSPGRTKIDYAIETAAAIARATLDGGDRAGLVTFDRDVYNQVRAGEGHAHFMQIVDHLLETRSVVDESLTDLTDSELVATVARYLAYQEGIDLRIQRAPAVDDPIWESIAAGPRGELYDMKSLRRVVRGLLHAHRQAHLAGGRAFAAPKSWWTRNYVQTHSPAEMGSLRLFCRLRGIELPYRTSRGMGQRAQGLAAALTSATAKARSQLIVIISDLFGLTQDAKPALRAIALAKRRHHHLMVIAPFAPDFAPAAETHSGRRVAEIMSLDEQRRFESARRLLVSSGVPVIRAGPQDTIAHLARQLSRTRTGVRRFG